MGERRVPVKLARRNYMRYNDSMISLKLTQIGNSVGLVLPKEALAKLGVEKGDILYLVDGPDGGQMISPYNPEVARQIALGEEIMSDYRDTLRALAK